MATSEATPTATPSVVSVLRRMDFAKIAQRQISKVARLHQDRPFVDAAADSSLPSPIVANRSAKRSASGRSCVTITMVMPSCCCKSRSSAKNRFAGCGVEIARRLIREKNFGTIHERSRDGHALLLSAGKFRGAMTQAMRQAHALQSLANAAGSFGALHFRESQRQLDVFFQRHARKKVERLEDHADGVAAIPRQFEGESSARFWPRARIEPEVTRSSPAIRFKSVDLPEPDEPSSARNSPSAIENETSSTARTLLSPMV